MIENAEIFNVKFGFHDNNPYSWLVLEIDLHYCDGNVCQGFSIDGKNAAKISDFLRVCGKTNLHDLFHSYVRVKTEDGSIISIGHILENKWLDI